MTSRDIVQSRIEKKCYVCKKTKPLSDFANERRRTDGKRVECKSCDSEKQRAKRENNAIMPHRGKALGVSITEYRRKLEDQGGMCAICGKSDLEAFGIKRRLALDHNHETGNVRGLLCSQCNWFLGKLENDREFIIKAQQYLIKHGEALY